MDVQIETCKNDNKYMLTNLLFFLTVKHIIKLSQAKTRITEENKSSRHHTDLWGSDNHTLRLATLLSVSHSVTACECCKHV